MSRENPRMHFRFYAKCLFKELTFHDIEIWQKNKSDTAKNEHFLEKEPTKKLYKNVLKGSFWMCQCKVQVKALVESR